MPLLMELETNSRSPRFLRELQQWLQPCEETDGPCEPANDPEFHYCRRCERDLPAELPDVMVLMQEMIATRARLADAEAR